jgi:hypothetical protein
MMAEKKKRDKRSESSVGEKECRDNVRFSLSDETGVLKFKTFDIVNTPDCARLAEELRKYLLARPLREIDVTFVRSMECPQKRGYCIEAVARVLEEHIEFFT